MIPLKQAIIEVITKLPDDCTVEDIMYEIDFVAKVLEGIKEADEGKFATDEEMNEFWKKWGIEEITLK